MDIGAILLKSGEALWQVALVALLFGAGLPALFAVGVRALNSGSALNADGTLTAGRSPALGRAVAGICFGICVLAVLFGIVVLIWGKQLFGA
jgi:hypothetical protein